MQKKFYVPDVFIDDVLVPAQIEIYYSKLNAAGSLLIGIGVFGTGVYLVTKDSTDWVSWLMLAAGLAFAIMGYRHLVNRRPQLILSNEGVKLSGDVFYNWLDIKGEDTKTVSHGKSSTTYFVFNSHDGEKSVDISELDIRQNKLDSLLRIYRGRSDKKHSEYRHASLPRV